MSDESALCLARMFQSFNLGIFVMSISRIVLNAFLVESISSWIKGREASGGNVSPSSSRRAHEL